jgi:hypothetical protein
MKAWITIAAVAVVAAIVGFGAGFLVGMDHYRDDYYSALRWAREIEEERESLADASRATVGRMAREQADLRLEISALQVELDDARSGAGSETHRDP